MRIVVTGAGGMLGHSLVPALERAGHEVLALRREEADVTRLDALRHPLRAFSPEWVVNLAADTRVDDAEARPDHAYLVNALGAKHCAIAAADSHAALLHLSTDYVFDGRATKPYREYDPTGPLSVYGASKLAGERAIAEIYPRHVIVRTAWLYGRGGRNFVDTILRKASEGDPLAIVDDQRGAPTSTHDLAERLEKLIACGQFGTYHVTNGGECTWYEFAKFFLSEAGTAAPVERVDSASLGRPAPRPSYSVLSNQLAERALGAPMPSWQDAVRRFLASHRHTH